MNLNILTLKTISEIDAKKDLNKLNDIKNVETIKYKRRTPVHKELLNLFDDLLDLILTDKTLESESREDKNKNENEKVENKNENEKVENKNENEKVENKYENENENENDEIIKILLHLNEYDETVD